MARVQAGDGEAFSALYNRYASRAHRVACAVGIDVGRAEDVVQEAFLSIWRGRAGYRPHHGSLDGWVLRTVRHRAIDSLRSHGRHDRRRAADEPIDERLRAPGSVEDAIGDRDVAARLRTTLSRLPAGQRHVIALAYLGGLSTSEIARELSLPLGTVKGRLRLGLMKLRAVTVP